MLEEYTQLGALAIIVIFTIREVFTYLKTRKNGSAIINYEKELASINLKLSNHYTVFSEDLREVRSDIKSIKEAIVDIKINIAKK